MLRGLEVKEAEDQLKFLIKGSAPNFEKLMKSAVSNAEINYGLDKDNLYIKEIKVNEGPKYKRWKPRAYGRATMILKRTSDIEIILDEKVEGKGRKKVEKKTEIRDVKAEEAKKKDTDKAEKKEKIEERKQPPVVESKVPADEKEYAEETKKRGTARGFLKKVFRRKSM